MASRDNRKKRSRHKAFLQRLEVWYRNQTRWMTKLRARQFEQSRLPDEAKEKIRLHNSMTNWQRNQMGKKYKGALWSAPLEVFQHFASLPHWKKARVS